MSAVFSSMLALQFRQAYLGGSWTTIPFVETLEKVTWQEAAFQIQGYNTIVQLAYHVNYYVHEVGNLLEGKPFTAKDALSFKHPEIQSAADWEQLVTQIRNDGDRFIALIEALTDEQLAGSFIDPKYGTLYRNLVGIIEHLHYHLGQIIFLKKMIANQQS